MTYLCIFDSFRFTPCVKVSFSVTWTTVVSVREQLMPTLTYFYGSLVREKFYGSLVKEKLM